MLSIVNSDLQETAGGRGTREIEVPALDLGLLAIGFHHVLLVELPPQVHRRMLCEGVVSIVDGET